MEQSRSALRSKLSFRYFTTSTKVSWNLNVIPQYGMRSELNPTDSKMFISSA